MVRNPWGNTCYRLATHTHTMVAVEHDGSYWPLCYTPATDDDGYYLPDNNMDCDPKRVANARLIAAAPDLLEALEVLAEIVDDQLCGEFPEAYGDALRAIAKAKGNRP